jgi:hypothetical protein
MLAAAAVMGLAANAAQASFVVVGLNTTIGTTAGDDANTFEGIGNPVNLAHTPLRGDDATDLAQGPGTLPSFHFELAAAYPGGIRRASTYGGAPGVRRDQKHDASALKLDLNNDGSFSESALTGFGMHADGFVTFDLDRIRSDNSRPAGEAMHLSGLAGVANIFPSVHGGPHTSAAILLDGVMVGLFNWTDAGYTGSGPLPAGYDQMDSFSLALPGTSKYLTFAAMSGSDLDPAAAHVGWGNVMLALPEPGSAMFVTGLAALVVRRRGRSH